MVEFVDKEKISKTFHLEGFWLILSFDRAINNW